MSALTYAYVRKDLTFMEDPRSQSFLKAFLRAMYDEEYIGKCEESFGFLSIKDNLRDQALQSIDMLRVSADAPEWVTETEEVLSDGLLQGQTAGQACRDHLVLHNFHLHPPGYPFLLVPPLPLPPHLLVAQHGRPGRVHLCTSNVPCEGFSFAP